MGLCYKFKYGVYVSGGGGGGRYISLHECLSFASSLCSQVLLLHQWHGIPTESGRGVGGGGIGML